MRHISSETSVFLSLYHASPLGRQTTKPVRTGRTVAPIAYLTMRRLLVRIFKKLLEKTKIDSISTTKHMLARRMHGVRLGPL